MFIDSPASSAGPRGSLCVDPPWTAVTAKHFSSTVLCRFTPDTRVDAWGSSVTSRCFLAVLLGQDVPACPAAPVLPQPSNSTLLLYMNGHGGDTFFKFRDEVELTAGELASALVLARLKGRFARAVLVIDTCQASTMGAALAEASTGSAGPDWAAAWEAAIGMGVEVASCATTSSACWFLEWVAQVPWVGRALQQGGWQVLRRLAPWLIPPMPALGTWLVFSSGKGLSSYATPTEPGLGTPLGDGLVSTLWRTLGGSGASRVRGGLTSHGSVRSLFVGMSQWAVGSRLVLREDHADGSDPVSSALSAQHLAQPAKRVEVGTGLQLGQTN